ncbi:MAG: class I SAM-dependent methyltransferase [Lachnospiraceae bacterium]|nr:class I SAM-dependent methyltransferase [Lachnospiraceae bacterium]
MKISLTEQMETLLIPLYGRAQMSKKGLFKDRDAEYAITQLDYDFSKLNIQEKTQMMLSIRSAQIDDYSAKYLREHPDSTVVYLGCGLDARAHRLNVYAKLWYDLDYPQVINIKKQFYVETVNYKYIPSTVTNWDWLDRVECNCRPVLVIAEGLLMYLNEQDIKLLFINLRDSFKNVTFIFDAYSEFTAKQAKKHPSLKKTGANIQWGVDSFKTIESFGNGIVHIKTIYLTDSNTIPNLPLGYRIMFKLADKFKAVKEAHRIFVMELTSCPN